MKNPLNKLEKPKVRYKQRGFMTFEEYDQLLNYLDNCNAQNRIRDAALIAFFYASGCRLTKAHQQNKNNLDFNNKRFTVLGKGEKERTCVFNIDAVKTAARRAGITKNIHLHILRNTRATHPLKKGAKLETIQRVLGHSNISTTQIYAYMNMDEVQDEVTKIDGDA